MTSSENGDKQLSEYCTYIRQVKINITCNWHLLARKSLPFNLKRGYVSAQLLYRINTLSPGQQIYFVYFGL